ncbi:thymidylate synthase [Salinibacter ruber]|uniref:thymidylate synthase n=1 Tax=Salinibacter ruber TaxID=146919 RepID=UPI002167972E|nr:thymidylate synthase [Salinibacter ruber]MCS4189417.1 thymidylate synthase [Salinibacter ruber]
MTEYLDFLRHIRESGTRKKDRTGTGTISTFGYQMRFDLQEGFPLVTTKKVFFKGIAHELLWFLSGETNIEYLQNNDVHIWDEWADEEGDLGPVYGKQWRRWETKSGEELDQIEQVIRQIKEKPHSRRHVVSAWNAGELEDMALPPCHVLFQFYVDDGKLSCQLYQRSVDAFIGGVFNIAEYSLLTHMVAQQCNLDVGEFVYSCGDSHIYLNHLDQVDEQLSRDPYPKPELRLTRKPDSISDYRYEDIELVDYNYHPKIKAPIAV